MKIFRSALLATSSMTLFSYLYSMLTKDNTREPQLLGKLIYRLRSGLSKRKANAAGWAAHYSVGLLFAELYGRIWEKTGISVNARTGLVFGGLSGIAAILIWKFTLSLHPFAPAINFGSMAVNLFLAHLVFGLFAAVGIRLPDPPYRRPPEHDA